MELISERLVYTKVSEAEFDNYMSWYTSDEVMKHITGKGLTYEEGRARFERTLRINQAYSDIGFYAVKKKDDDTFVGIAKLTRYKDKQAEVGYGSLPAFWGQGYATEMLCCLVNYAKTMPWIKELIGIVDPDNQGSVKVLTNHGFKLYEKNILDGKPAAYYRLKL
ncbi:GNAT family N-acetyltransferase [Fulvivirgaceae bacterium BMA10]|uniref:GNAT family N-acetyltransferase n=1 Tax=Splendidivirga corallicola TaxID=3051826 RepID=A0ABT8KHN6_9BACT|nr:GNAT family N-acetyltransferase [Fulvivirgaceae bacterium BMA10]